MMTMICASLSSCSEETAMSPQIPETDDQFIYAPDKTWEPFTFSLSIPTEDPRSRFEFQGMPGVPVSVIDGIWSFNNYITGGVFDWELWYCVYLEENGAIQHLFDSSTPDGPKPVRDSSIPTNWKFVFSLPKSVDVNNVKIAFYAAPKEFTHVIGINGVVNNCDVPDAIVSFSESGVNGLAKNAIHLTENGVIPHDNGYFYEGYMFYGPALGGGSGINTQITLKRPWAEVHVLTDELMRNRSLVKELYPDGIYSMIGLPSSYIPLYLPSAWSRAHYCNFDGSLGSAWAPKRYFNDRQWDEHHNSLSDNQFEKVTFDGRSMDYIGCIKVFPSHVSLDVAIINKSWEVASWSGVTDGPSHSYANCHLPLVDFKANQRYIFYNNKLNDGDIDVPGEGMFTNNWTYNVIADDTWDSNDNSKM